MAGAQGRVKELIDEDMTRPRSDSTGSRTRAWSGSNFDSEGRPRSFTQEAAERQLVVMAVDGSDAAAQAFDWFTDVIYQPNIFLLLLHVPEIQYAPYAGDMGLTPTVWDNAWMEVRDKIPEIKSVYEKKLKERGITGKWLTLSTSRKPGEALVKAAHEYKAKYMVVASRGLGKVRRVLVGSVSDYIVHHAKIPVIVCRKEKK